MKIVCVPIAEDRGLLSPVSREFASAPMFLLVDSATLAFRTIPNTPQRLKDRGCDPCEALEDTTVDLLIVARIEQDTLAQITSRGVPVHGGAGGTAADALAALIGGRLPALHADREPVMTIAERASASRAPLAAGDPPQAGR